ncbi:hypothetical protein HY025_02835 [Candidatus Daviesbacteria bacterium]|nr:hypothetical protein [Candidatus Daviesbacteria bacterium]
MRPGELPSPPTPRITKPPSYPKPTSIVVGEQSSQITRRTFLKLGVLASLAAIGYKILGSGEKPTPDQVQAAALLEDPNQHLITFEVRNDPDVIQVGGLAKRTSPLSPVTGSDDYSKGLLQPGYKITGIPWEGKDSPVAPAAMQAQGMMEPKKEGWVAFKDPLDGKIYFVSGDYLKEITPQSISTPQVLNEAPKTPAATPTPLPPPTETTTAIQNPVGGAK